MAWAPRLCFCECNSLHSSLYVQRILRRARTHPQEAPHRPWPILPAIRRVISLALDRRGRAICRRSSEFHLRPCASLFRSLFLRELRIRALHTLGGSTVRLRIATSSIEIPLDRHCARRNWWNHHKSRSASHLEDLRLQRIRPVFYPLDGVVFCARDYSS